MRWNDSVCTAPTKPPMASRRAEERRRTAAQADGAEQQEDAEGHLDDAEDGRVGEPEHLDHGLVPRPVGAGADEGDQTEEQQHRADGADDDRVPDLAEAARGGDPPGAPDGPAGRRPRAGRVGRRRPARAPRRPGSPGRRARWDRAARWPRPDERSDRCWCSRRLDSSVDAHGATCHSRFPGATLVKHDRARRPRGYFRRSTQATPSRSR